MTTVYSQITFDNVARRYNLINKIPEEASQELGKAVTALAPSGAPLLDMGCGAGRIAGPASQAGAQIIGMDISRDMLAQAQRSFSPYNDQQTLSLVEGDIVHLPYQDDQFEVVLSINVLHLVPQWEAVLHEARRVMRPSGLFVQGRDWVDPNSCLSQMRWKLREIVMGLAPNLRPTAAASPAVLSQKLGELGGKTDEPQTACRWITDIAPDDLLNQMATRQFNETWMLPDHILKPAIQTLSDWVGETWATPHVAQPVERRFNLIITRF